MVPKQFTSSIAGSHSPFSIHFDELDPSSTAPGGQSKFTVVPTTAREVNPEIITDLVTRDSGFSQLQAAENREVFTLDNYMYMYI